MALGGAIFDQYVLTFNKARIIQPPDETPYSKLMSERVRLRGISLHSLRPRIRLHMAGMADSVSPRGTGAAGLKHICGRISLKENSSPCLLS